MTKGPWDLVPSKMSSSGQVVHLVRAPCQRANVVGSTLVRAHTESTNECINKWNNKLISLSSLLFSKINKLKKKKKEKMSVSILGPVKTSTLRKHPWVQRALMFLYAFGLQGRCIKCTIMFHLAQEPCCGCLANNNPSCLGSLAGHGSRPRTSGVDQRSPWRLDRVRCPASLP